MPRTTNKIGVYLEVGKKRTIAGALDWPGWCRIGNDEASALQALVDYAPRYARALRASRLEFSAPKSVAELAVVERLHGNATTDYGVPDQAPSADTEPMSEVELRRLQTLLKACWRTLDAAARSAGSKELRKGPRGGGRDTHDIVRHVLDAEGGYLSRLARKVPDSAKDDSAGRQALTRKAVLDGLAAAAHGEVPAQGPRGGKIWSARYFARRVAWHILDHAWEIEDRTPAK